jgi:hypothetical protein
MSATQPPAGRDDAGRYEIRIAGHLDARWSAWFDGLSLLHDGNGTTVIQADVADQAALHSLIQKVRDIGLPLVSVTRAASGVTEVPPSRAPAPTPRR